jgi:hypothetical protein
VVERA